MRGGRRIEGIRHKSDRDTVRTLSDIDMDSSLRSDDTCNVCSDGISGRDQEDGDKP